MQRLLGFLNFFILQWFCIRISNQYRREIGDIKLHEASMIGPGAASIGFEIKRYKTFRRTTIQIGALPMAGMNARPWRYIGKKAKYITLTSWRQVADNDSQKYHLKTV